MLPYVTVPQNLVVRVPEAMGLDAAAFTTLGAIAMQGVRQANPRMGEFVCVIGLGLLGQIDSASPTGERMSGLWR